MSPTDKPDQGARVALRALTAFLFLTGMSGLVYQVVWTRYLGLLLGSSSIAIVVVLATFMGGLAIGSLLFGRIADRPLRRLRLYAWLELGVGAYCILFPAWYGLVSTPYLSWVAGLSATHPMAFTAARLAFAAALLLPPTILMGGTMPVATRFLVDFDPGVRVAVARLYWVNSIGAVTGAVLAGFVLLPTFGMDLSLDLAGTVNIAVAVMALAMRRWVDEPSREEAVSAPSEPPLPTRAVLAVLAAISLSGFAGLGLEVAWTRLLALVVGGSTYAFTIMVATFILGIALGSLIASRPRIGRGDPLLWLAGAFTFVAVTLVASYPAYPRLPWTFQWMRGLLSSAPEAFPIYQGLLFVLAAGIMLVPTLAMGATLPLAARVAAQGASLGSRVGLTWALNTAGTLLGALLSGMVLLPRLGLQSTFALLSACYAAAALVTLVGVSAQARRGATAVAVVAALALPVGWVLPRWDLVSLNSGAYRKRGVPEPYDRWVKGFGATLLWSTDGATSTVSVFDTKDGDRFLKVNGKTDASLRADLATQLLLGHIPAMLGPAGARRALVVGVGSGATVRALSTHADLAITAVEIEPAVLEAARRYFQQVNGGVLDGHPRVQVLIEDAKTVFQRAGPPYDLVVSEPSNPWLAGIGGLFSKDYFEAVRARLAPGGVMAQWLQTYEMDDETVRLVLRTFRAVFPEVTVWQSLTSDYILLGSAAPLRLEGALLTDRLQAPAVRDSLALAGIDSVEGLLARQVMSSSGVAAVTLSGPLNTDQFPLLEYDAPRGFFAGQDAQLFSTFDERPYAVGRADLFLHAWLSKAPTAAVVASMARSVSTTSPSLALALLTRAAAAEPAQPEAALALASLLEERGESLLAREHLLASPRTPARDALLARVEFSVAAQRCQAQRNGIYPVAECSSVRRLGEAILARPVTPAELVTVAERLARAELWSGAAPLALKRYRDLMARPFPKSLRHDGEWHTGEAAALLMMGDKAGATSAALAALRFDPASKPASRILASATAIR
jgi:spermidine synthase